MKKAIFFDLDGTLHHMNEKLFSNLYFETASEFFSKKGFNKDEILKVIYDSVMKMKFNDGKRTNEDVFISYFSSKANMSKEDTYNLFMEYYKTDYEKTLVACSPFKESEEILRFCRDNYDLVVLMTNPVFPRLALEKRMNNDGLYYDQFDYLTTFDNSSFCKPNPLFFKDLCKKLNVDPKDVIVVGNHALQDALCAHEAGIDAVLLKPDLIDYDKSPIKFKVLELNELIPYLKTL